MKIKRENYEIYKGDCLELMKDIPDKSVDMILCDLPYGTTKCSWDIVIPFNELWKQYNRIIKDNGAIVLFSSQPFTTDLINSNRFMFRYDIIWNKMYGTDFALANKKPMKAHEIICVFYKKQPTYNKQMIKREKPINKTKWKQDKRNSKNGNINSKEIHKGKYEYKNPTTVYELKMAKGECDNSKRVHPTEKPVDLLEYLIKTYTNEGETVLDNCMGSGSTGVACINANRKFIGIELDDKYFEIAENRIKESIDKKRRITKIV